MSQLLLKFIKIYITNSLLKCYMIKLFLFDKNVINKFIEYL